MKRGLILALAIVAAPAAGAETICADRPGKSSQACTVPAGHFQLETSLTDWTLSRDAGQRDTALVLGETGLKLGLTDRSHIDIDVTPWQRASSRVGNVRGHVSGIGDVLVSYRYRATAADAGLQLALSPFVKLPTAKRPLGDREWEGGLVVPVQYAIPHSALGLSLAPEVDWTADSDGWGHHATMVQVADLGWQATPNLNLSGEIWGQWDWDRAGTTRQYSADGAVAYLVRNNLQLDSGFNIGLNRATPDLELYAGIAELF